MRIIWLLFLVATSLTAAIIDPARLPTTGSWAGAGVEGGIPTGQTIFASVKSTPYNAVGNGVTNDSAAFNAAIAACPEGQVITVPSGTYRLNSELVITKGIILRGAGPGTTILDMQSSDSYTGATISFQHNVTGSYSDQYLDGVQTAITAGTTRGSTSITVASNSGIVVGNWVLVAGDDTTIMNPDSNESGGSSWTPMHGELVRVTNVSGTTITIDTPLQWTLTSNRFLNVMNYSNAAENFVEGAALEDMSVDGNGATWVINFTLAANCWLKNVEVYDGTNNVIMWSSAHNTIHGCYVRNTRGNGSGGGYGILLEVKSTANLIENNRFYLNAAAVLIDDGSSLNVVAYNYCGDFQFFQSNWLAIQLVHHRSHPMFNLFEGNFSPNFYSDDVHGSASHGTIFRNRLTGVQGAARDTNLWVLSCDRQSYYFNSVGNVLGTNGTQNTLSQTSSFSYSTACIYALGFGNAVADDANVSATFYKHGDYQYATDVQTWDSGNADHTLPNSLYLTSKPSWFGILAWPAYDPSTTSTANAASADDIPAGYRYLNGVDPPPGGADADPPTPSPMTFSSAPAAIDSSSVTMVASVATDAISPPTEYFFDETSGHSGGTDSGWQSSSSYTDTGLSASTLYTYRVKARDAALNETTYSGSANATTPAPPSGTVDIQTLNVTNLQVGP